MWCKGWGLTVRGKEVRMREVTIIVRDEEVEEKLKQMNEAGISISQWFMNSVLKYDIPEPQKPVPSSPTI